MSKKYYVTATDKFMSGWGLAENKINKMVFECDSYEEAEHIENQLNNRDEMKYVNIRDSKPYYNKENYFTSYKTKENTFGWYN